LQHAHIVPLYFVATWPERNLQGLVMPYLGGLSLAQLLHALRDGPPAARTGQHLLDVVKQARPAGGAEHRLLTPAPVHRFLARASFAEALCWVGICLADALQYAHERGLVHLDLKPDNVLVAGDGLPMLLDFHLAREPIGADGPVPDRIGGTAG